MNWFMNEESLVTYTLTRTPYESLGHLVSRGSG